LMKNNLRHFDFNYKNKNVKVLVFKNMQEENIKSMNVILKNKRKEKMLYKNPKNN